MRRRSLLLVLAASWVWMLPVPLALVDDATRAVLYGLVAVSLVLLTGWVGQISLAQAAFVGIGSVTTSMLLHRLGIPFPLSLPFAVAASAAAAVLLGVVALRVRGLYLAIATLIFAWMADAWLFTARWFVGAGGAASIELKGIGRKGGVPSFDLHDPRVLYLFAVAGLALGIYAAANLRDSKTGRAFFALRGSETAAASLGIDVTRYKLLAFGVAGAMAGLAGHLKIVWQGTVTTVEFNFVASLLYLSMAVVGGLGNLPGAVAAGVLFSALTEVFFRVPALNGWIDLVSGCLLLGVLLLYPGGLAEAGRMLWARLERPLAALRARLVGPRVVEAPTVSVEPFEADVAPSGNGHATAMIERATPVPRTELASVLEAQNVTVRFGGLTAVDDVSLSVREGEIVGLIGPNGAGKTTLFNAILGLNDPVAGEIRFFGRDVTHLPVHERAARGVGRTFQLIQLFPHLDVFGNVLAGTHRHNTTGFVQHLVVTERAMAAERTARARTWEVMRMLEIDSLAHRPISELPFGVLRMVELARAVVTGAPFLMLDEPASGLDNAETDRLGQRLRMLRAELGVTVLLIEHDVSMVTSVSDYIYVINRGQLLAEGMPQSVQENEEVVAAYLGEPEPAAALV